MTNISAKIIADSISTNGNRITTFELEYPRFIHSELMTHRLFSRNTASSRAIPIEKMTEQVRQSPAAPVHWGKNQPGMQAKEELNGAELEIVKCLWQEAAESAAFHAEGMAQEGAHKQVANRILEPFQWLKTVVTATEFDNFFWLRKHEDAQPEIKVLAEKMWEAFKDSNSVQLKTDEWHVPYYKDGYWKPFIEGVTNVDHPLVGEGFTLADALAISSSCCAQVSYRKLDDSLDKAKMVYKRLVESEPVHASPFEHQASPMDFETDGVNQLDPCTWQEGVTHMDRHLHAWSGNFKGWIQHRQLIPNNACWKYKE